MTEVVMNSTQHMSQTDLQAMATYLKDLPANEKDANKIKRPDDNVMARGKAIYVDQCMGCHMADGKGQTDAFPPLAQSSTVQASEAGTLIHVVLAGDFMADTPELPTGLAMPRFDWKLDDQQVADVLNYIRNSWDNRASVVSADDVKTVRESVHDYGPRFKRLLSFSKH